MTMGLDEKAELTIQPEWAYGRKGLPDHKYPFNSSNYTVLNFAWMHPCPNRQQNFPSGTYDVTIVKQEKQCFTMYCTLCNKFCPRALGQNASTAFPPSQ
jgi:hypothetical protein